MLIDIDSKLSAIFLSGKFDIVQVSVLNTPEKQAFITRAFFYTSLVTLQDSLTTLIGSPLTLCVSSFDFKK